MVGCHMTTSLVEHAGKLLRGVMTVTILSDIGHQKEDVRSLKGLIPQFDTCSHNPPCEDLMTSVAS